MPDPEGNIQARERGMPGTRAGHADFERTMSDLSDTSRLATVQDREGKGCQTT